MYLSWQHKTIADFSESNINSLYNQGYVFTRAGKGKMDQTRSVRVDLLKFKLNSENRRVLRKTENLLLTSCSLPLPNYHWSIGKLAKDFYAKKFGDGTFSANKIKELLTDTVKSNFNKLFCYVIARNEVTKQSPNSPLLENKGIAALSNECGFARNDTIVGYCICYSNSEILHYCYPFYELLATDYELPPNLGIGMMTKAIVWAREQGKKHIYLGSAKDAAALYKFQFEGVEWFDGEKWQTETANLKKIINQK